MNNDDQKQAKNKFTDKTFPHIPPMKVDSESLIKLWKEIFNIYSFNNPEYNIASLHLVIGVMLKHCRVKRHGIDTDPRISILYLKPSFSGGSAGYDFLAKILHELQLKPPEDYRYYGRWTHWFHRPARQHDKRCS